MIRVKTAPGPGPICVISPTRDRPQDFLELAESFAKTSTHASLIGYVDADQEDIYRALNLPPRVELHVDQRLGPIHSVNRIAHLYRNHCRIYGCAPDDSRFLTPGWDDYVVETIDNMPKRLGVLSASHNQGDFVNLAYVSREWIEVVGWYAYPDAYHFIWDTILEMIGEATHIVYSDPERFKVEHRYYVCANKGEYLDKDAISFYLFCVNDRRAAIKRVREAMA